MNKKILIALLILVFSGGAIAVGIANHTHDNEFDIRNGHSGRTDAKGGHNCSDSSKRKGLCTGYHYH